MAARPVVMVRDMRAGWGRQPATPPPPAAAWWLHSRVVPAGLVRARSEFRHAVGARCCVTRMMRKWRGRGSSGDGGKDQRCGGRNLLFMGMMDDADETR
eukprot:scaffold17146_cov110-Isochrysis_galbana.AAC.3